MKINKDELSRMWIESKEEPTEEFYLMIRDLAEMTGNKYFPDARDLEDLISGATLLVIEKRNNLREDASDRAYPYFVTIIKSHMIGVLHKRKKNGSSV